MQEEYEQLREEFDFGYTLVGVLLVIFVLYVSGFLTDNKPVQGEPIEEDDRTTEWTLDQIKKYNGKGEDGRILIGCNGFVFDVTKSPNFQEGGMYGGFAGHDISIACANYSTEEKYLDQDYIPEVT